MIQKTFARPLRHPMNKKECVPINRLFRKFENPNFLATTPSPLTTGRKRAWANCAGASYSSTEKKQGTCCI